MLLSIPALPVLAEGDTGTMLGGNTAIGVPYNPSQGGRYIPGVPNPGSSGTPIPYMPVEPGYDDSGYIPYMPVEPGFDGGIPYMPVEPGYDAAHPYSPYIPGVPNPGSSSTKDKGIVRTVKVGEDFTIKLKENASTGYQWSYTVSPKNCLTVMGDYTSQDKVSRNTVGASSDRNVIFRANRAGTYTIKFTYERSFDNCVAKTQVYTIYVK